MDKQITTFTFTLVSYWVLIRGDTVTMDEHVYDISFNDKLFTDNITFELPANSAFECGVRCNQQDSCVSFTFYQEKTCRGYSARMTSCSASVRMRGAKSYVKKTSDEKSGFCQTTGVKRLTNASLGLDLDVFCEDTWLVFQKRQDGSVDFYRDWNSYANGFGDVHGEFWLGLEPLHRITTSAVKYQLRVELMKWDGSKYYVLYSNFSLGSADDFYTLNFDCFLGGTSGDGLSYHRGVPFTTFDEDHDPHPTNKAVSFHGAWWYRKAQTSNLNGNYTSVGTFNIRKIWWPSLGGITSLKSCQMMIRPAVD